MAEATVSPLQSRIINLRDNAKQSWGTISRIVSEEFGRQVKRNYCQVVYRRAKAVLRGYKAIAERQAEWERPMNRAKRYSRRQWRRFSPARRKLEWRLSPYAPDPVRRALDLPKRAKRKRGEALDEAKRSLAGLLRSRGDEQGARQVEASIESRVE